ncbi:hypothetical protein AAES_66041 [Amazona aestiva]|uniref:Uncharacterized protein n=1 Tax=Amazona aestiva TaxID=12930 RepID=A0A0Q3MK04_AMAAE|nr:hypothetical protein AAES_66041 [Amazona aestiva]
MSRRIRCTVRFRLTRSPCRPQELCCRILRGGGGAAARRWLVRRLARLLARRLARLLAQWRLCRGSLREGCNSIRITKVIHKCFRSSETVNPEFTVFRATVYRKREASDSD